jgi:glycosyltransferase involved in cell wall biosynthesis
MMGGASVPAAARATAEARSLARELGLLDRTVFFNDDWVPYEERANWLLEASCALSAQLDHLESRFAFRTRLLDCFWAGLPVVCTTGDDLAELVELEQLGATAPPGSPEALAIAIERVLERGRQAYAEPLRRAAERHAWPRVAAPLRRWIGSPELPPRLGDGVPKRPAQRAREGAYLAARATISATGMRWPSLRG